MFKERIIKWFDKFTQSRTAHVLYLLSASAFVIHILAHLAPLFLGGFMLFEYFHGHTH
jgi:hypothetical protein